MDNRRRRNWLSRAGAGVSRAGTSMSVRARIVVLALIPVVGLGFIGGAYLAGERDVDEAFRSVRNSSVLEGAANEFRVALVDMRVTAQVFAARPTRALIDEYAAAHGAAVTSLNVIERSMNARDPRIAQLQEGVSTLKSNFDQLLHAQELLGFGESSGIEGAMRTTAANVERIINQEMGRLTELDAKSLLAALSNMRRFESEYRLNRTTYLQVWFFNEHEGFKKILAGVKADPTDKAKLDQHVAAYADAFRQWIETTGRSKPRLALIEFDS
jgi:methyl-accepting chemotaxis protein